MRKRAKPEIVIRSQVVREDLPLPVVYYPNHYGTLFAFAEDEDAMPALCSCSRAAVANLISLLASDDSVNADPLRMAPLSNLYVPDRIAAFSLGDDDFVDMIRFGSGLCHRCTGARPTLRYCHEMYGGEFTQYYGWYINQCPVSDFMRQS